jgi:Uma2 family endonuclease
VTIVQPDLLVVAMARRQIISERGIEGAADFVIEILSPRTAHADRTIKFALYAQAGVREYWIVDSKAQTIESFTLRDGVYDTARTFGVGERACAQSFDFDFEIDVQALFAA